MLRGSHPTGKDRTLKSTHGYYTNLIVGEDGLLQYYFIATAEMRILSWYYADLLFMDSKFNVSNKDLHLLLCTGVDNHCRYVALEFVKIAVLLCALVTFYSHLR